MFVLKSRRRFQGALAARQSSSSCVNRRGSSMSQKSAAPSGTMIGLGAQPVIRDSDKIGIRYLVNGMVGPFIIKDCLQSPAAYGKLKLKGCEVTLQSIPVIAQRPSITNRSHSHGSKTARQI
jgi:hypothetical protein